MATVWRQRTVFDARATAATVAISALLQFAFLAARHKATAILAAVRVPRAVLDGWSELTLRN